MYSTELEELAGKIVTVKTITGEEIIAKLASVDTDNGFITLQNPQSVLINGGEVIIAPVCFSAQCEMVTVRLSSTLFVTKTLKESANDYLEILDDRKEPQIVDEIPDK